MPGFLKFRVFGFGAVGGEEEFGLSAGGGEGDDVPDFGGDDMSRDEVELVESVGSAVRINVALVGAGGVAASGGLDLDAEEVGASVAVGGDECDVEGEESPQGRRMVSPCSAARAMKKKLGPFALEFEVGEGHGDQWLVASG